MDPQAKLHCVGGGGTGCSVVRVARTSSLSELSLGDFTLDLMAIGPG